MKRYISAAQPTDQITTGSEWCNPATGVVNVYRNGSWVPLCNANLDHNGLLPTTGGVVKGINNPLDQSGIPAYVEKKDAIFSEANWPTLDGDRLAVIGHLNSFRAKVENYLNQSSINNKPDVKNAVGQEIKLKYYLATWPYEVQDGSPDMVLRVQYPPEDRFWSDGTPITADQINFIVAPGFKHKTGFFYRSLYVCWDCTIRKIDDFTFVFSSRGNLGPFFLPYIVIATRFKK